ncbi:2-oxoacid:acceptor oxidoreductase family protein [Thermosediminibacter oceani]|uniref:2-oxoglutarate ferredoxin oxidoreductase, gamma subunit n=1 Tax=Thermosediminibacter oceani (strain ATCC BAA-1034 / DSM 16646 / JW/IW-1228P) TaxID=555079 RepID=D9S3I3_THEOJ|nr:2-oxoacid:acceptor oxidoreductase family protein [Thermosediminibacter oceani]ADL07960.1 2-oxoglutarate ferredoxin oxidoreductase, gamma subunit [Thermosediminibacter oceani DSM 16646]
MEERLEIRLSGSGGQGLILAGIILAEAAILDGKNAVQSQSYGPEARGGASRAEVVISDEEIDYPKVTKPQVLLALTNEALNKFKDNLASDGIIIIDSSINKPDTPYKVIQLPIIETARDRIGKSMVANIVAVGVITALTKVVSREAVEKAVLNRVPKGTEELNKKALYAGFELGEQLS